MEPSSITAWSMSFGWSAPSSTKRRTRSTLLPLSWSKPSERFQSGFLGRRLRLIRPHHRTGLPAERHRFAALHSSSPDLIDGSARRLAKTSFIRGVMRRAAFCVALAAALMPASVGAQSTALTESDALARLSADSPRARAIRAGVDVARVDVLTAARWPNPRITWDRESVAGVTEHIVMVTQPLPVTGRRGL